MSDVKPILGYDQDFDKKAYKTLSLQQDSFVPQEFTRRKNQLDTRTKHNLETALGERFNLQISQVIYRIEDGRIISEEHDEPFTDVIKRGQRHRQENGSGDVEREKAEVEGFEKVQNILTDPQHQDAKVIIISPRGKTDSMYQHNFFDIYQKEGAQITMTRFASTSSIPEFLEAANQLDPFNNLTKNPKDCDFLKNPLSTYKDYEEIIENLNLDENAMTQNDYQKLTETVAALKLSYLNALYHQRYDEAKKIFIATLNLSDDIILNPGYYPDLRNQILAAPPAELIAAYGWRQPRAVLAGCGLQTNFAGQNPGEFLSALFPYSLLNFAPFARTENADTSDFPCPRCGHIITYGAGISKCPSCHLAATCG
ncbi:hypothetical protein A3D07_03355 [Candidatus Curtissbacteria bacterium RIFCSPHIGHO2_02_FULL_42_15]|nr:MAG: hypothetical protein A3D07_03355 [Candidatus Curtissbacteria bacterium RIFCSPHIGHO2_02_FULL_42_15]